MKKLKGSARKRRFAEGDVVFSKAYKDFQPKWMKEMLSDEYLKNYTGPGEEKVTKDVKKPEKKAAKKPVKRDTPAPVARSQTPATPAPVRAATPTPAATPAQTTTTTRPPAQIKATTPAPKQTNYFKDLSKSPKASDRKPDTSAADASRAATQAQMAETAERIRNKDRIREERLKAKQAAFGEFVESVKGELPGGKSKGMGQAKGGKITVKSASKRADGCAIRGKTRAR